MLFHGNNEIVHMLPPMAATHTHYSPWVDVSHWHHATVFCRVGQHQNEISFAFRKGIQSTIEASKESRQSHSAVPLKIRRWWDERNSDWTATTHLTLNNARSSTDSTINSTTISAGPGVGYDNFGSRGELYIGEIDNAGLSKDSAKGNEYDCIQVRIQGAQTPSLPSGIGKSKNVCAVMVILSGARYTGRTCRGAEGKIHSRDW